MQCNNRLPRDESLDEVMPAMSCMQTSFPTHSSDADKPNDCWIVLLCAWTLTILTVNHEPTCFTHRLLSDKLKVLIHRHREKRISMHIVFTLRHLWRLFRHIYDITAVRMFWITQWLQTPSKDSSVGSFDDFHDTAFRGAYPPTPRKLRLWLQHQICPSIVYAACCFSVVFPTPQRTQIPEKFNSSFWRLKYACSLLLHCVISRSLTKFMYFVAGPSTITGSTIPARCMSSSSSH